nr:hypothetical protein [uncultured Deefgea sp.]
MFSLLGDVLYIKIYPNKVSVRNVNKKTEVSKSAFAAFTSQRLLVGEFTVAEKLLKELITEVAHRGLFRVPHRAVIQPQAMIENGLCQVEERLFLELALGSGAFKAKVHVGADLHDDAVLALFN